MNYRADPSHTSPPIAVDLATAYFQRAETEDKLADAQKVAELLSAVLQQNPDDEIALFNRAVVNGHLFDYRKAINDWEHYLRIPRDKAWDREATQYLAETKEKLQ